MTKTFDYVRYDEESIQKQETAKKLVTELETFIHSLGHGRPQSLSLTKVEECYMWIGKAIRDEQVRRGVQTEHKPERGE